MTAIFFLPGAGGSPDFWNPVGNRLPADRAKRYFGWPGLGHQPHDPKIRSFDDLVQLVSNEMTEPVDLVAQSMGGVMAAQLALAKPRLVRRLVLCVTSGGVDMTALGASDWRDDYRRSFPNAVDWIIAPGAARNLPVERIVVPVLLIWGDSDPISPVAVGQHLAERLPDARLQVVKGGNHDLAQTHAEAVAALVGEFLG
jgi:pimeloyl-ACP methyl ester carboxylesterase